MASIITAGRGTTIVLDPNGLPALTRPSWRHHRPADGISRATRPEAGATENVALQPGNAWTLDTLRGDLTRVIRSEFSAAPLGASDVKLATNWTAVDTYRKPTDSGIGADADVISSGVPAFTKRVVSGSSWNTELTADVNAVPKPTLPSADIPMNRVLVSKATYPANCGFAIGFAVPGDSAGVDTLLTFYFGGPTEAVQEGRQGGRFCLTLRGNGRALLKEFDGSEWVDRREFGWEHPGRVGNLQPVVVIIQPYGRDCIGFKINTTDILAARSGPYFGLPLLGGGAIKSQSQVYRNEASISGYMARHFVTGTGEIRMDVRRDLRPFLQVYKLTPPESGTLVDLPVYCPTPLPAGTPMRLALDTYEPADTSIVGSVYNAEDDSLLSADGNGDWLSVADVQSYYVKAEFSSPSREQTPVLYGYSLRTERVYSTLTTTPTLLKPTQVSITGPDTDPSHETAHLTIQDALNGAALLRTRGQIPCWIATSNEDGGTSYLFAGEIARALARKRGRSGKTYPSPFWYAYECDLVGMWARLSRHLNQNLYEFHEDENAPIDPRTNERPPWKITAIIDELLADMGFPPDMRGIPDLPLRLFAGRNRNSEEFLIQPGQPLIDAAVRFAREYLGMVLTFDPNAGARGMWRLLYNPSPPYTFVASFLGQPAVPGRLATHPDSYGPGATFIQEGTLRTYVKAPEANYISVYGAGGTLPDDGGPSLLTAYMYNPVSFDFVAGTSDPTHPDYLGYYAPLVHIDYSLSTQEAVNWVCRRFYEQTAHAQKWGMFRAPLLLIEDPTDPYQTRLRPLRFGDAVYVYGEPALVRNCNPDYQKDHMQFAEYEVLFV